MAAAAVAIIGTLTGEGIECPAMRGDDGVLYTLAGLPPEIEIGDRIEVNGEPQAISFCQQGSTIAVSSAKVLKASGSGQKWKR